jgi:small-conductance mechanosensitive channel
MRGMRTDRLVILGVFLCVALFLGCVTPILATDVYSWLSMIRIMERRIIESDIRFNIDGLFREAGIVIAFPQRDVHLDAKIHV